MVATASITHTSSALPPFPRVYTATVTSDVSLFASEVDLLNYSKVTNATSKISFMVHDKEELIRLRSLARTPPTKTIGRIKIDGNATSDFQKQSNYVGRTTRSDSKGYNTISDFPCYKNLHGSFQWMDAMVERSKSIPGLSVKKKDIGNSYLKTKDSDKGYDIWVLKVTGMASEGATKGIFFIMTGIHAREYAPPELASRWIESIIKSYGKEADITAMLDYTEIHLVLQSNPDGRQVAETDRNAYRRKNRNPNSGKCSKDTTGVDLNRNFPFRWNRNTGSSKDECSNTYRGKAEASEPEVKAIVDYTKSIFPAAQRKSDSKTKQQEAYPESTTMGVFLDIHSYGNLVLPPWSYSSSLLPPNNDGFTAIRRKLQFFTNYDDSLGYLASGTSGDFAYGYLGAASFIVELGNAFYQDCNTFEDSILSKNLAPLTYLAKISKLPFSIAKGPDITSLSAHANQSGMLTVKAKASDSAYSSANVATSKQTVQEIRVFVNVHPYSVSGSTSSYGKSGYTLNNGSVTVSISSLARESRHVVYAQATDSKGYRGPVTAAYFFV